MNSKVMFIFKCLYLHLLALLLYLIWGIEIYRSFSILVYQNSFIIKPNIAIIKTYLFTLGKKEKINEHISKELKRTRKAESFIDNKSMKVKIVDNKSDATPPAITTQEISTSTNNTKSWSEPNNDSAILKSIKHLFVNLNLVNDEINNILTEAVVANKILMQSLSSKLHQKLKTV